MISISIHFPKRIRATNACDVFNINKPYDHHTCNNIDIDLTVISIKKTLEKKTYKYGIDSHMVYIT